MYLTTVKGSVEISSFDGDPSAGLSAEEDYVSAFDVRYPSIVILLSLYPKRIYPCHSRIESNNFGEHIVASPYLQIPPEFDFEGSRPNLSQMFL